MAIKADDRLIVALDVHTMADVDQLVQKLGDTVSYYKVGMELFYSVGPDVVRWLSQQGKKVFLDLRMRRVEEGVPLAVQGVVYSILETVASSPVLLVFVAEKKAVDSERVLISCHKGVEACMNTQS